MVHSNPKQDTLIGMRLGVYRIQELKGEGGFASVYLAVHESLGRPVAIKVLWPHLARNPDFVGRFLREARAAAGLRHPNIVQVHDVGQQGQYYYIVMDFIEGKSLLGVLQEKKRLDPATALSIVQQIGSALDYAHGKGVVHRDVKPSNILIDGQGKAYLSDFGIAKAAWTSQLTRTGVSLGTPEYMSPEQCEGKEVDHRSDLYSLGVVLYEMLCGGPPFRAETPLGVVYKQVKEPPPPLSVWKVKVPKAVEDVVMKAVAKDPGQRFQSGAEMAQALETAISGPARQEAERPVKPTPVPLPAQRRKRLQPLVIGGASVLGLIAVVVGLVLWSAQAFVHPPTTPTVAPVTRSTPTSTRMASATPTQLATSAPTPRPKSTWTPVPAQETRPPTSIPTTPKSTDTPRPTSTATPTQTPTVAPTVPTQAPTVAPTAPPPPADTPVPPTHTPTRTPIPDQPAPTHTPEPLPTVEPTPTPAPPAPSGSGLLLPDHPSPDTVSVMLLGTIVGSVFLACRRKAEDMGEQV